MKFLPYILKHLRRNWVRTTSTVLGIAVCIFLFATLQSLLAGIDASLNAGSAQRLWTRHKVSLVFTLPLSYKPRIAAVPGVRSVANATWFGGVYRDPKDFFANFAVDMREYLAMNPEFRIPPDQREALLADRRGCAVGVDLAEQFGWSIGDTVPLESVIPPYRVGKPLELTIRAIYDTDTVKHAGVDRKQLVFHYDYLYEATGRRINAGTYVAEIDDPANAAAIGAAIDRLFENSEAETKTETESAFVAGFIAMAGNLSLLLNAIGLAVTFTILLVSANTMSMAIRERRTEIAVLKTLGFGSALVLGLVLAESLLLGIAGGAIGLGLGALVIRGLTNAPMLGALIGALGEPGLPLRVAVLGMIVSTAIGLLSGLVPALSAYRSGITDTLRQV